MIKSILLLIFILSIKLSFGQEHNCIISDNDFEGIKSAILNITSEEERVITGIEIIKKTNCCFYSKQLYQIFQSLSESSDRINFFKGVYNNILDLQSPDFNKLLSLFTSENDKNSLNSFIESNKSGCSSVEKQHQKQAGSKSKNKFAEQYNDNDKKQNIKTSDKNDETSITNVPDLSILKDRKYIEWIEPAKNIKTIHGFNRIKAKVYCSVKPQIALMIDNIIIQTLPDKVIPFEDKGYIYSYYVGLHEGDNHIMLRLRNPSDSTFTYSKLLIINYQPE